MNEYPLQKLEKPEPRNGTESTEPEVLAAGIENKPEFPKDELAEFELFLDGARERENLSLALAGKAIEKEPDSPKRSVLKSRLICAAMATMIAVGCAESALAGQAKKLRAPEKKKIAEKLDIESMQKKREEAYEKLKKILAEEKTKEKVNYIKETFGDAVDSFLGLHRIRQTMEAVRQIDEAKASGDQDVFVKKDFPFAMTPGSRAAGYFNEFWSEKKDEPKKDIKITGFENISGLSNERVREILENDYSKGGLARSIKEIKYIPEVKKKGGYYVLGEAESFSISNMSEKDSRAPLRVYNAPDGQSPEKVFDILRHEIGHTKDWNASKLLTNQERVNFLYEVAQRFKDDDRFKSDYIETMVKDEDKQIEAYKKVVEYWGEIVRNYMKDKKNFQHDYPLDAQLIEKWIKK